MMLGATGNARMIKLSTVVIYLTRCLRTLRAAAKQLRAREGLWLEKSKTLHKPALKLIVV